MEQIFIKLLNMSISAGYLVLALILLRPLLKKAPKYLSCILWGLVGLRLCLPVSIESILSLIPSTETVPPEILYAAAPQINTGISFVNSAVNPILSESMAPDILTSVNPMQVVMIIGANLWVLGMAVMVLYALISYLALRYKLREAVRQSENIWVCDRVDSPFLLGLIRPRIYLPSDLPEEAAAYVIAHEKAHLRRKDHWWKPLGFLLLTVYWFNPLMWVAYILLCRDIEYACDEKVLQTMGTDSKKAYSEALLRCSAHRRMISACPVAFGEDGVKGRIKSVLNYKKPAFWIILIAIIASIAIAVCFLTDPPAAAPSEPLPGEYQFRATVAEIRENSILVTPVAGEPEAKTSDLFKVVVSEETAAQLHYGDTVRITYDGMIQELYPAILPNVTGIEIESSSPGYDRDALLERYPQYDGLDTTKGLEVYVWKNGEYRCGVRSSTNREVTTEELWAFGDGISLGEMSAILSTYAVTQAEITILYTYDPAFSGETPTPPDEQEQAYIEETLLSGLPSKEAVEAALGIHPLTSLGLDINKEYKLIIYAYQLGENAWRFQFVKNSRIGHTVLSLMKIDSMSLEKARQLLKSYDLAPEDIPVIVYSNPYSSYLYDLGAATTDTARKLLFLPE